MDTLLKIVEQLPMLLLLSIFLGMWVRSTGNTLRELREKHEKSHDEILKLIKDMEYHNIHRLDLKEDLHKCIENNKDLNAWFDRLRKVETKINGKDSR